MYNEFVKDYCRHHNLEIIEGVNQSFLVDGDTIIAEFKDTERLITFCNSDGSPKSIMRKGDLLVSVIENLKLH